MLRWAVTTGCAGAVVRAHPRPFAKSCGQLDLGQYVCGVERDGAWLRLARADEADDDDAQWVCVHRDGKPLLEAVRDSDMGSATAPPEDPLADKFDRPFEPRLQAPDFQAPEEMGQNVSLYNLLEGFLSTSIILATTCCHHSTNCEGL